MGIDVIFSGITDVITNFGSALGNSFTSIASMFYTPGTSGQPGSLTFLGTLLLISAGVGIVYWAFRMIKGLIKRA